MGILGVEGALSSLLTGFGTLKNEESTDSFRLLAAEDAVKKAAQRPHHSAETVPDTKDGSPGAFRAVTGAAQPVKSGPVGERVELTAESLALLAGLSGRFGGEETEERAPAVDQAANLYISKFLLESLTGRRLKVVDLDRTEAEDVDVKDAGLGSLQEEEGLGPRIEYLVREITIEQSHLIFKATGRVRTADGVERGFDIKLRMSRSLYSESRSSGGAAEVESQGSVLSSFVKEGTEITGDRRLFDLAPGPDAEVLKLPNGSGELIVGGGGHAEEILKESGPGWSKNTHARPRVGYVTGQSAYGNADGYRNETGYWVDESGPVYNLLRVFAEGPNGEERLVGLEEVGVMAIYLKYTGTEVAVKESWQGREAGLEAGVKRTGAYTGSERTRSIDLHA